MEQLINKDSCTTLNRLGKIVDYILEGGQQ